MAKSFSELRKQRGDIADLTKKIEAQSGGGGKKEDDRFWSCQTDKAGNGSAVIRFLPAPAGEEDSWVKLYTHGFKGPTGKWYIENSRTTLGKEEKDPVTELNNELWASKIKANEDIARAQKRKLGYYSNVYIISDPANPENEGKVKIWRYGKKIFDKIQAMLKPEFEEDEAVNPFCLWTGANFRLKIAKVEGYANFDKSSFATPAPLKEDDDELEKIWSQAHSLKAIIDPSQFKSYEELEKRLNFVLATGTKPRSAEKSEISDEDQDFIRSQAAKKEAKKQEEELEDLPPFDVDEAPAKPVSAAKAAAAKATAKQVDEDEDDDLAYFKKLAEG
jgi:hypothetical protein